VLLPLASPLRLEDDTVLTVDATFLEAPDELGLRKRVTERVLERPASDVVAFARLRSKGRGAIMLHTTKLPQLVNGKFALPEYSAVDGLLIFGPSR